MVSSSSAMGRLMSSSVMGTMKSHNTAMIVLDRYFLRCNEGLKGTDLRIHPSGGNLRKFVVVRGLVDGNEYNKKAFIVDSWDIGLWSCGKAPTLMLRSGQTWMELRNPAPNELETRESETMESNMVAAYFMAIAKHTPHASKADVWRYIHDECRGFTLNPNLRDLEKSLELIEAIVEIDYDLQQSPILAEYFPGLSRPNTIRRTHGPATEERRLSCVNEVNRSPIASLIPPQHPGLSSPNDVNRTPIASRPEEPGNVNEVYQNPTAPLIRPEEPGLSDVNDVYRPPTAPVVSSVSEPKCPDENEEEGFKGRVYSKRPTRNGLPVLDVVREATLAEGSSSGLHLSRDSITQALDTPVEVSGTQHLALPATPGEKGKGSAGEGNAAEYTEADLANWVDEPDVCAFCDDGVNGDDDLLCCDYCMRSFHPTPASGLHRNCESLGLSRAVSEIKDWLCPNCEAKQHQCFACGKLGISDPTSPLQTVLECDATKCKRFYHPLCVVKSLHPPEAQDAEADGFTFACPLHKCEKCNKPRKTGLVKCRRCPRAWHKKCLPEGSQNRMWKFAHKYVMYCDKHKIDEDLETPVRDHIVFPKAGEKRGRETQESSGSKEPASDNPSARREPRLESDQLLVEGLMANTSEAASLQKNVEDISDPIPLQPVEEKPRRPESERDCRR